jgi:hypothetical protein
MEAEEHFTFKATCEHEDDKKYNVYPTCEGATFRKDKDEDSDYDSDEEMPSLYENDPESNDDRPYGNQGIYYDSDDDIENMTDSIVRALLQYIDSRIAMAEIRSLKSAPCSEGRRAHYHSVKKVQVLGCKRLSLTQENALI